MPPTAYEIQRQKNLDRNRLLLESLGIEPLFPPPAKQNKNVTKSASKKRKAPIPTDDSATDVEKPVKKQARPSAPAKDATGLRRSARNSGKTVDYNAVQERGQPAPVAKSSLEHDRDANRPMGKRKHDPKTFGAIPGVPVGTWWETREACSLDAIHAPWVAGISGGPKGTYSIALSGGYPDDVDLGSAFTYTGSGGRDLKGTKSAPKNLRTAPQSCDQSFDNSYNKSLKISSESKKPVRVIRGYKLDSPYAPAEGYRYDGLYVVEKAWMDQGVEGFLVCKFALKRLANQAPLITSTERQAEVSGGEESGATSEESQTAVAESGGAEATSDEQ